MGWRISQAQLGSKRQQASTDDKEAVQLFKYGVDFSMNSVGPIMHAKKRERINVYDRYEQGLK